jgi:hypothetical protein
MIHNYRRLDHLESVLERVQPEHHDIVALQVRVLEAGASGDRGIIPEQLFTANEQVLFTRVLALAEKHGKTVHLTLIAANQLWDGMVRAAQSLQSAIIVVGPSAAMSSREEAKRAGHAWERLPLLKRRAIFEVFIPPAQREVFYLGPHTPHLTPKEIDVLHRLWLRFSDEVGPEELHHHDVVHFALTEIERELVAGKETEILERLKQHLQEIKDRRARRL